MKNKIDNLSQKIPNTEDAELSSDFLNYLEKNRQKIINTCKTTFIAPRMSVKDTLVGFATILMLGAFTAPASGSALKELILQPHRDEIQECTEGIKLLHNQEEMRLTEQREWLSFFRSQHGVITARIKVLNRNWENRISIAQKELQAAMSMSIEESMYRIERRQKRVWKLQKEFNETRREVSNGEYRFELEGIGRRSSKELDNQILKQQKKMDDLQEEINKGEWRARIAGLGKRTLKRLKKCIKENEESISEKSSEIAHGNYKVHIPTIGEISRNGLMERIAKLEKEINEAKMEFNTKKWRIYRSRYGYQAKWSELYLEDRIQEKKRKRDKIGEKISEERFGVHIPADDWKNSRGVSVRNIKKQIETIKNRVAKVRKSLETQKYHIDVKHNRRWSLGGILNALKRENLEPDKARELRQALDDLKADYNLNLEIKDMNIKLLTSWLPKIKEFAHPALYERQLDFDQWSRYRGEYPIEERAVIAEKQHELARLNAALAFLP